MYHLLALVAGVVISAMVSLNGGLTASYGAHVAAVIIHVVGVLFALALCAIRREHVSKSGHIPWWAYCGGAVGVLTTLFNNYAFGRVSITSIVALGLLGQSLSSVLLDAFGLLGLRKQKPNKASAVGYLAALTGVFIMLDSSVSGYLPAVALSLGAGATVVLSRTVNARLSTATSPLAGAFINHLVGLPICISLALCFGGGLSIPPGPSPQPWMYLGGALGVVTVLLFNITVPKISAFRLTLLSFLGQIFAGIGLDWALGTAFSSATFWGGLVIAAGLLTNMSLEQWQLYKRRQQDAYWARIHAAEQAHWAHLLGRNEPEPPKKST